MRKPAYDTGWARTFWSIGALALTITACSPDGSVAPEVGARSVEAAGSRQTGIITTTIIAPVSSPDGSIVGGRATAINEAGVVAGWSGSTSAIGNPIGNYAFTWKDGLLTNLGTFFEPVAINRSGAIAGNVGGQAVIWEAGVLIPLGTLGGTRSTANDMNDKGQVVGTIQFGQDSAMAFVWEDGVVTELGTLGGPVSFGEAINNHGQVAGYSQTTDGLTVHAFVWEGGVMTDIGTLGGTISQAFAINDRGDVAGLSSVPVGGGLEQSHRPFLWHRGVMTRLPLEGDAQVDVFDIADLSDAGHLVGSRNFSQPFIRWRAFVWHDGVIVDLPDEGEGRAMSVNSSGEIAGFTGSAVRMGGAYLWSVGRHGP